jgi:DNA modification methylase
MNKIICGDALTELQKIEDESIDCIITSPPYFKQRKYTDDILEIGNEPGIGMYLQMLLGVFNEGKRIVKPTGNIVWNMGDIYIEKSLQLLPYRFACSILDHYDDVKLINNITWVKTNPTPRQYKKRLINSTEPFFHFVKSDNYYYNRDAFLDYSEPIKPNTSPKKGKKYKKMIYDSSLTIKEKYCAILALNETVRELSKGKIADFRMKIRGIHKKAFGGQSGGRNNQIDKQGYTIIKMYGKKLKRDVIENSVANTKNIDHPAVFPLKVIAECVKLLSKENDVVLDPFCGSGQTCVVSKSLNRQYLGIDLNPKYCNLAENRLKNRK